MKDHFSPIIVKLKTTNTAKDMKPLGNYKLSQHGKWKKKSPGSPLKLTHICVPTLRYRNFTSIFPHLLLYTQVLQVKRNISIKNVYTKIVTATFFVIPLN